MADARLMLHLNGTDAATSTVDAMGRHPTITFNGTAQISTGSVKTGNANLLLDGDSDYLTIPASEDWNIVAVADKDRTIDFLVKHVDHVGTENYIRHYENTNNSWRIFHVHGSGIKFSMSGPGVGIDTGYGGEITDTLWHHIALCRVADEYGVYLDGVQVAYVQDTSLATFAGSLYIGAHGAPQDYFDGRIDELRIDKSNHFSAAPNVGKTDRITVLHSVAHYKLDDDAANTTLADTSGNGYTGALAGGDDTEDINIVGQIDGALQLDGAADYGNTVDFDSIFQSSFSVGIWVKPDDGQPAALEYPFGLNYATTDLIFFNVRTDGVLRCYYESDSNGADARTAAAVFSNGAETWHHILMVADSSIAGVGGLLLYLDGVLQNLDASYQGDTTSVVFANFDSTGYAPYIGAIHGGGGASGFFAGGVDDVIIYNKAVTAAEALATYNAGVDGKSAADAEYEYYELLPEFPTLTRSPQAKSWSEQMDPDAVKGSGYSSGMPLIDEQYTFAPKHFKHVIDGLSDADKATFDAFYLAYKARTILWLNTVDSLYYQVHFAKSPPRSRMLTPGLWRIEMEVIQVSSQTIS